MTEALDLDQIRDFRNLALSQYHRDMSEQDRVEGTVPTVILYLDILIEEVERLRGENLAESPSK